ncbi:uncharacterized protein CANTADRAFT_96257 [Suhomyces tanzawaensis NRRL Y-17324]|uniref:Uncharacterized protein n=1 Tax=Suhomyces tanzawaensis NRRL Y-17324 TaxID=984487 RepID=A0A1E4SGU8_9ASCO|nr:uncharacterized protein CANTADRAFT_96257 [Suhomyces tanzawaensis NRRL Y-17324]ODV78739.1 hypothetical protein CANTADRAFT_96257 [Suhomyces tanzawaensis NRRL Y-17324]
MKKWRVQPLRSEKWSDSPQKIKIQDGYDNITGYLRAIVQTGISGGWRRRGGGYTTLHTPTEYCEVGREGGHARRRVHGTLRRDDSRYALKIWTRGDLGSICDLLSENPVAIVGARVHAVTPRPTRLAVSEVHLNVVGIPDPVIYAKKFKV